MGFFDDNSGKFNWFGGGSNNSNPLEAYNNNLGFNNNSTGYTGGNQAPITGGSLAANSFTDKQYNSLVNPTGTNGTNWMNNGTLQGVGSALQGAGALAGAWAGLKQVKLAREMMGNQVDQWNKNYESQAVTINNRLNDQNAWKKAQGRTDMASLVPKYGNIG